MERLALTIVLMLTASGADAALIQGPLDGVLTQLRVAARNADGRNLPPAVYDHSELEDVPSANANVSNRFGNGDALATATDLPLVSAIVHANTTEQPGVLPSTFFQSSAQAFLAFVVAVDTRFGQPDALGEVPVKVDVNWSLVADTRGYAKVSATFIGLDGINTVFDEVNGGLFGDTSRGNLTQSTNMRVGTIIGVDMLAQADALAKWTDSLFARNNLSAQGMAFLDPVFSFDQATFDAQRAAAGLPTFNLNDAYQFVFSPGIQNLPSPSLVPLPPSVFMLLPATFGLLTSRRRSAGA